MSGKQLTMLRQARSVGRAGDLLVLVDMAEVLLNEGFPFDVVAESLALPVQGNVSAEDRLREAMAITSAWPPDALLLARQAGADWHAMYEPARWWRVGRVEREDVVAFAKDFVAAHGRWPRTDELRRHYGLEVGHKAPGDTPGQGALL